MKRSILQSKFNLLLVVLLLVSCSQDEFADKQDTPLPEGVYPLEIASVTLDVEGSAQPWGADAPQTRVSENKDGSSSEWQNGDEIRVRIGNGTPGTYTYQSGNLIVDEGDTPAYWTSNAKEQTITAWYTPSGSEMVDLSNQTNRLAYVLTAQETADFNEPVSLSFSHALAKVRVVLEGEKADEVEDVRIKTHTSCILHTDGTLSADGQEEYIPMVKTIYEGKTYWEANVVPEFEIKEIQLNGSTLCTFTPFESEVGKMHEITINVEGKYILIEGNDDYTVTKDKPVIIRNSNAKVYFKNYKVNECYEGATIKIESGSPTLIFEGKDNEIQCGEAPILLAPGASVTIKGSTDKPEGSKLTVRAGNNCAGIGSGSGDNADNIPTACGNITIENITLHANGGTNTNSSGAAIGTSAWYAGSCGNITIRNSTVHAQGGQGAAAIGTGYSIYHGATCGEITIEQSKIYATVEYFNPLGVSDYAGYGACIGHGASLCNVEYTGTVGEISITTTETVAEFFSNDRFKRADGVTTGFYKVGKGSAPLPGNQVWSGVKFNGDYLATGDKNGYPDMQ